MDEHEHSDPESIPAQKNTRENTILKEQLSFKTLLERFYLKNSNPVAEREHLIQNEG